jgi:pyruvate ferredoxin oxidoreductase alpha subunit
MLTQEQADSYVPAFRPYHRLDADDPISFGLFASPDYYMEFRYAIDQAMNQARSVLPEAGRVFSEMFGRDYSGLVEGYRLDDADCAIVAMGSICGTVKDAIDQMRNEGKKVGLLKLRTFRPFPTKEVQKALSGVSTVAVLDKNISLGSKGAAALEIRDALYGTGIPVHGYIIALGGRDVRKKDIAAVVARAEAGSGDLYYGLREEVLK